MHSETQNLRIIGSTSSSLTISLEKPRFLANNVTILAYDIEIHDSKNKEKIKAQTFSDIDSSKLEMTTEIRGLEESITFDIEISPRTDRVNREPSRVSQVTPLNTKTSIQACTNPKALQPPSVIEKSYHTISLK